jgi:hypothetical protein
MSISVVPSLMAHECSPACVVPFAHDDDESDDAVVAPDAAVCDHVVEPPAVLLLLLLLLPVVWPPNGVVSSSLAKRTFIGAGAGKSGCKRRKSAKSVTSVASLGTGALSIVVFHCCCESAASGQRCAVTRRRCAPSTYVLQSHSASSFLSDCRICVSRFAPSKS